MNARAKEFVWNLLKTSASPLAGDQLFNELQDNGFHSVITLYVPETGDADVVANDKELFGDAATIYQETETTCMQRLRQLLAE